MFNYFQDNYTWSSAFVMGLMAGGQLGEMHRWLEPLRGVPPTLEAWAAAWNNMAKQQEQLAAADAKQGYERSTGARYLRAAIYRLCGERQLPPGDQKAQIYADARLSFYRAIKLGQLPLEHVEVESPDGVLPGFLIRAETPEPAPVVIFYSGLDVTKELLYCFIRQEFAVRGMHCLVIDTPGVGEPLRLHNVASRPDYEVPTAAIIDFLETRPDVDASRIGILGISLGGYYAPRAAAFEPRIKACVAWGGVWDYGEIWKKRWETQSKNVSVGHFQLPWIMGTKTMEAAVERVQQWKLADVLPRLTQPLLMLHGEHDLAIPVEQARLAFAAAGSTDKQLRIFTEQEGGAEHVQADEPDAARQLIGDWLAERLVGQAGVQADHLSASTRFVSANGIRFAYRRFGKPGTIPLVLNMHFTGTMDHWDPLVTDGLAAGREVILFNNAGVSSSSGEVPTTIEEMAANAAAFIRALQLTRVDVLGFSLGGLVAQQLALAEPQLVRKLVLVGTGPRGGEGMAALTPEAQEIFGASYAHPDDLWLRVFFTKSERSQAAGRAYLRRFRLRTEGRDPEVSDRVAGAQVEALGKWGAPAENSYAYLKKIFQPTLVINGGNDVIIYTINSYLLQQHLPDARLILYPDASHGAQYQYPHLFVQDVAGFLDGA
jgi:pimeloyl-ACP methyl ester carboxylesterase